jgi:nitrate reductase NapE component
MSKYPDAPHNSENKTSLCRHSGNYAKAKYIPTFRNISVCRNLEIERFAITNFVFFSIISVFCFLKIFGYLDIIWMFGLHVKNRYNY